MPKSLLTYRNIEELKSDLLGRFCNGVCRGEFFLFDGKDFKACTCMQEFTRRRKLIGCNIPQKYWDFSQKKLSKDFRIKNEKNVSSVLEYANNISLMLQQHVGLYLVGPSGTAKTALGTLVLQKALEQGIESYFIRLSDLVRILFDCRRSVERIYDSYEIQQVTRNREVLRCITEEVKILMIDEIDKVSNVSQEEAYFGMLVGEFFDTMYGRNKILITTSNRKLSELKAGGRKASSVSDINRAASGTLPESTIDRLSELVELEFIGSSFRRSKKPEDIMTLIQEHKHVG